MPPEIREYSVLSTIQETPTTCTLILSPTDGTFFTFQSGQNIAVYSPDVPGLGKLYSISSAPCENKLAITVKRVGPISRLLCSLGPGSTVLASGPRGGFHPRTKGPVILLAGGMGITSCRSLVVDAMAQEPPCRTTLLYSAASQADMPFGEELYKLSKRFPSHLAVERFVTQEWEFSPLYNQRRMHRGDIASARGGRSAEFLISGSLSFVLSSKKLLLDYGVDRRAIQTEAYC